MARLKLQIKWLICSPDEESLIISFSDRQLNSTEK